MRRTSKRNVAISTRFFIATTAAALFTVSATSQSAAEMSAVSGAATTVDLELVLAVDVSMSMDRAEQRFQRNGYVAAFRSEQVIQAIGSGPLGRIAVTYMEWAGNGLHAIVLPWRILKGRDDALKFAKELEGRAVSRATKTSISSALIKAASLFEKNGITGTRRVIDVSGDGPNNDGPRVDKTRDQIVARGITINGLALTFKRPDGPFTYFDLPDLDRYYAGCVIGGSNAFMLAVEDPRRFAEGIKRKLILEIADSAPPTGRLKIQKTQFRIGGVKPTYDCLVGEKRWQQYQNEQW